MSEKIRKPLLRDKVITSGDDSYHVAIEVSEYAGAEVCLTLWPIRAGCSADGLEFPPDIWEELKGLVDGAIKDWEASE